MKAATCVLAAAPASTAPSPWPLVTALLAGALVALSAAVLHRKDGATLPGAIKRGGIAFSGATTLALGALLAPRSLPVVVALLLAVLGGTVFGVLDRMDGSSIPVAIWRGGTAFVSLSLLGFAFLAACGPAQGT
jgi:hypothetical protein